VYYTFRRLPITDGEADSSCRLTSRSFNIMLPLWDERGKGRRSFIIRCSNASQPSKRRSVEMILRPQARSGGAY